MSYGTINNDPAKVKLQVKQGIDAVIVDSVLAIRKGLTEGESEPSSASSSSSAASALGSDVTDLSGGTLYVPALQSKGEGIAGDGDGSGDATVEGMVKRDAGLVGRNLAAASGHPNWHHIRATES